MKSYKDFKSQINEVLKGSDPIEKWIDDFVNSKNPKFAGKTKAERIDMAKGAYYGAQKNEGYAASQNSTAVQDMEAVEYKGIGTDVVDKKKKLNPQPNLTTDKKQVKDFKEDLLKKFKTNFPRVGVYGWAGYPWGDNSYSGNSGDAGGMGESVSVTEAKVYDPITKKMVATKPIKVQAGGGATRNGVPVETGPSKYKSKLPMSKAASVLAAEEAYCESCDCAKSKCKCHELDEKRGLWDNIHAKRKRIASGSGERMRKPGSKGAPSNQDLKNSQKEVKESFDYNFDMLEEAVKSIDQGEYDYEGQMSRTQLQTTMRNCQDLIGMIKNNDNMPEWVQSKITLAQDYISTVRDYLQSKEELGEEVQIDELSKVLVARYANKVAKTTQANYNKSKDKFQFSSSRQDGMKNAVKRLTKEETQIDELSKKTLGSYVNKAAKDSRIHGQIATDFENTADKARKQSKKDSFKRLNRKYLEKSWKREDGIAKAVGKLTKEETLDEISKKTLANYVNKASHDAASGAYQGKEYTAQSNQHTAAGDWDASKKKHDLATKEFDRANKRLVNIPKATTKLAKEGFLNKSEEDDMQTLSAAEFYKKYGKNKTSHRQGRGTKSSDIEKYTEQVEESRGHKILNTFFKNREIAQRAFNGQNKPEEKKPEEKNTETPKPGLKEDDKVYDEKWKTFNSKNKKGEK